jgi:hypothetical protein
VTDSTDDGDAVHGMVEAISIVETIQDLFVLHCIHGEVGGVVEERSKVADLIFHTTRRRRRDIA